MTRLDGVYVARGDIYTCTNGKSPFIENQMYNSCKDSLQVNGAFIANTVKLNRYGNSSLRFGDRAEFPYGGNRTCEDGASRPVCAAETFNFSPELYLTNPALPPVSVPGQSGYDSITSLPPVL